MRVYADSSFIVSLYVLRRQTEVALWQIEAIKARGDSISLSELALSETTNAVYLGVFRKSFSEAEASNVLAHLGGDIRAGVFRVPPSSHLMWKTAQQLSRTHVGSLGCRSLDILHVASALLLNAELFLTFDNRQRALAVAAGLNAPDLLSPVHS